LTLPPLLKAAAMLGCLAAAPLPLVAVVVAAAAARRSLIGPLKLSGSATCSSHTPTAHAAALVPYKALLCVTKTLGY
jgi:hypothetical protein